MGDKYTGLLKKYADVVGGCVEENIYCLLYTSDAADERSSVDLGGRRIIKKKKTIQRGERAVNESKRLV